MKSLGLRRGVSLNPHTSITVLEDIIHDIDMVLLMTVNPGYGGQKFIPHSFEKIKKLRALINKKNTNTLIQVDGGVDTTNLRELKEAGAEVFVVGSFIFKSPNPTEIIQKLKNIQ